MKARICRKSGCGRTCEAGRCYCRLHSALEESGRRVFTRRGKSAVWHGLYSTRRWKRMSHDFLAKYPVCFICGARAEIADHIRPHRGSLELFFDGGNLQPMCWRCHSRKTFAENGNFNRNRREKE